MSASQLRAAWERAFLGQTDARPLGLMRICIGSIVTWMLAERIPAARDTYSDAGWISHEAAVQLMDPWHWSVFHHLGEPWQVTTLLVLGAVAATCFTVGFRTRIAGVLAYVVLLSLHTRNPAVLYGGDLTGRIFMFYLLLMPCGAVFSADAVLRRYRDARRSLDALHEPHMIPVWPVRLLQIQVATIYLMTGISKAYGTDYHEGTALWYALANPVYSRFYEVAEPLFAAMMPLLVLMTQVTLWWELAFAFMVPFRRLRPVALGTGLVVHGGIFALLMIEWWGPLMMISYLSFVRGRTVHALWLRHVRETRDRKWAERLELAFDPTDRKARDLAARISATDAFRLVRLRAVRGADLPWCLTRRENGAAASLDQLRRILPLWSIILRPSATRS